MNVRKNKGLGEKLSLFHLISFLLETGRTLNIVIINSLRATGDASFPVAMGALSMVMMSLPLGYFFVFVLYMGLIGIWARGIIMFFRWRSRKWERYSLIENQTEKIGQIESRTL